MTDPWFTATGEEDGLPLIFRARHSVPEGAEKSDYSHEVLVAWHFDAAQNNGMPEASTSDDQAAFEDALEMLDSGDQSYLMLVVTGNGRKSWYWYVKDVPAWMDELNNLLAGHPTHPIEIVSDYDPEWSMWSGVDWYRIPRRFSEVSDDAHAGYPMLDDLLALMYAHPQVHVEVGIIVHTHPRPAFYRFFTRRHRRWLR